MIVDLADQLALFQHIVHIPANGDAAQVHLLGDLFAGKAAGFVVLPEFAHLFQCGVVQPLAQLLLAAPAPAVFAQQAVNGVLVQRGLLTRHLIHLQKTIQCLLEARKFKGLYQIVHHAPRKHPAHDLGIIGRGNGDHRRGHAAAVQLIHKFLAGHGRGVVVQNDQVSLLIFQKLQRLGAVLKSAQHLKLGVGFHIAAVNGGHHGVVFHNDHAVIHTSFSSLRVNVRVISVPSFFSLSISIVPWYRSTSS